MILQVSNNGHKWKFVMDFDAAELDEVKRVAETMGELGAAVESTVAWRVISDCPLEVMWRWTYPHGWQHVAKLGAR